MMWAILRSKEERKKERGRERESMISMASDDFVGTHDSSANFQSERHARASITLEQRQRVPEPIKAAAAAAASAAIRLWLWCMNGFQIGLQLSRESQLAADRWTANRLRTATRHRRIRIGFHYENAITSSEPVERGESSRKRLGISLSFL